MKVFHTITAVFILISVQLPVAHDCQSQDTWPELSSLHPRNDTYPGISPDGNRVVYSLGTGFEMNIFMFHIENQATVQLTNNAFEDSAPAWSPDGRSVIFQREDLEGNRDIWQVSISDLAETNLTNTPAVREQHPRFSSGGSAIVFDSNELETDEDGGDDGVQNYEIFRMSLDDHERIRLTNWSHWDMYPSLSPDESKLAWRRASIEPDGDRNFDIYVKDLSTGQEICIAPDPAYDTNPHWSPAGDKIVFASMRTGSSELFIVNPDGTDLQRITNGASRSIAYSRPSFSFDGKRILANRSVRGVTDIVVINLESFTD